MTDEEAKALIAKGIRAIAENSANEAGNPPHSSPPGSSPTRSTTSTSSATTKEPEESEHPTANPPTSAAVSLQAPSTSGE